MEFSRQEYWSGLPFCSLGDLPELGIEPRSSALQADSLPPEPTGKPLSSHFTTFKSGYFLLLLSYSKSLCILDINPLSDLICEYFLLLHKLLLYSFVSFDVQKF